MSRRWLRVAHRGASGSAPEHTRLAFERAVALGVDMIELDVQLSRDHALVVMHDLELERTTTGHGAVREHDLAELKALDAGSWFGPGFGRQPVLSLEEVIALVDRRARLNVEVKGPSEDWPVLARRLVELLRSHELLGSTIISCFEPEALVVLREEAEDARLGLLWQQTDFAEAWRWADSLGALSIHPHWLLVSSDVVREAHDRGVLVVTWTVNEVGVMRDLVRQEIDGIISDFPERFQSVTA